MDIYATLIGNGLDWYVIRNEAGEYDLRHASQLSAVLECGRDMADYGIADLQQCWDGEDLGEDCITV